MESWLRMGFVRLPVSTDSVNSPGRIRVDYLVVIPVAICAFVRRVFVDDNHFLSDHFGLRMAFGTRHVGVAAGQWQVGARIVVEGGRRPMLRIVAVGTMSLGILGHKLGVVRVEMAGFALLRGALEAGVVSRGGLVAFAAGNRAMRAE